MMQIWPKAQPKPTPLVAMALKRLGIRDLKQYAKKHRMDIVRLETALVRYSKTFLMKGRRMRIAP